jgi:hypothetical protein
VWILYFVFWNCKYIFSVALKMLGVGRWGVINILLIWYGLMVPFGR